MKFAEEHFTVGNPSSKLIEEKSFSKGRILFCKSKLQKKLRRFTNTHKETIETIPNKGAEHFPLLCQKKAYLVVSRTWLIKI